MLDMVTGRIAYAVLSFHEHQGVPDKAVRVPISALRFDIDAGCFRVNVVKEHLKNALGKNSMHLLHPVDPMWYSSIHMHLNDKPYWEV